MTLTSFKALHALYNLSTFMLYSSSLWSPLILYAVIRIVCAAVYDIPISLEDLPPSVISWYSLLIIVVGVLLFGSLLIVGYHLYRETLQHGEQSHRLRGSIIQLIQTMSSVSLPTDDGLKMMRYLISIWILRICEVYPLYYIEESTFQPLNEQYFLITVREKDILDQAPALSSHPPPFERCGLRAQMLLSWVHGYLFSPKLSIHHSSLSILQSSYLDICSSLPTEVSPTLSLLSASLFIFYVLIHCYLFIFALFLAIHHLYSRVNVLQEILTASFLIFICLLFSSSYLLISSLHRGSPQNLFSFPLITQWKQIIHLCRHILAFNSQKDSADEQWVYSDQIWTEEELDRNRPSEDIIDPYHREWGSSDAMRNIDFY